MNALSLAPRTEKQDIKITDPKSKDIQSNGDEDLFSSIISSLIGELDDTKNGSFLLHSMLHSIKKLDPKHEFSSPLLFAKGSREDHQDSTSSQSDATSIEELLALVLSLQQHERAHFPTSSLSLKKALQKPDVVAEFRAARSIDDLLKIARKNGIEVKNFQIFKEEAALDPQSKQLLHRIKSEEIFTMIEHRLKKSAHSMKTAKTDKPSAPSPDSILRSLLQKSHHTHKHSTDPKIADISPHTSKTKNSSQEAAKQIDTAPEAEEVQPTKELAKELPKEQTPDEHHTHRPLRSPKKALEGLLHETGHTSALERKEHTKEELRSDEPIEFDSGDHELHSTQEVKTAAPQTTKPKQTEPLHRTFQSFAETFKEKIESYKPPLMKIKMELNPKHLGEVDVTMIHRGNNLHITINSNPSTIALFANNQSEFKNAMVNMGYTGLQMSFSDNGKNGQQGEQHKGRSHTHGEAIPEQEELDRFEIVVPRYV